MLQCADHTDRIEIVVVTKVRDTEELALHIALAIGNHHREALAELLHDRTRVNALRREYRSASRCWTGWRKQFETQGLHACTNHRRRSLGIVDESVAAVGEIAVTGLANVVEGRTQTADQRNCRRKRRLALHLRLALLAKV